MARRDISFVQGGFYHIYNRGARRVSIFREARNYDYVSRLMTQVAGECQLTVVAYCLLPNHYHWLVRQDGEVGAGMLPRRVFGSYSQAYNRTYRESGTLFQGPYLARAVEADSYMRHLCRYIHANPVKHGLVDAPELWPYSDYSEWITPTSGDVLRFVQSWFGSPEQYAKFVAEYIEHKARINSALLRFESDLEV